MKRLKQTFIKSTLLILLLSIAIACSSDSDDNNNDDLDNDFFAKVDGTDFNTNYIIATQLVNSEVILITAETSDLEQIQLMLPGNIVEGTYNFNDFSFGSLIGGSYSPLNTESNFETFKNTGTITITEYNASNKVIKGTFSSETETKNITEGNFDITYIVL